MHDCRTLNDKDDNKNGNDIHVDEVLCVYVPWCLLLIAKRNKELFTMRTLIGLFVLGVLSG